MRQTRSYRRVALLALVAGLLVANPVWGLKRLAYTRPGGMLNVPVSSTLRTPNLFSAGFASEVFNVSPYNSASGVYFDVEVTRSTRLGFSSVSTADTTGDLDASTYQPPLELGFHLQQRVWSYGNVSFSLGIQDLVLTQEEGNFSITPDVISYFGVISSEQPLGDYHLNTYMGFGTGALAGALETTAAADTSDTTAAAETSMLTPGVFAGFLMKTPAFAKRGGVDVMGEFVMGQSGETAINVGLRIPLTSQYRLLLGIVNIENLPQFGTQADKTALASDAPGLVVGLNFNVPRLSKRPPVEMAGMEGPRPVPPEAGAELPAALSDSLVQEADYQAALLRDSLRIAQFEIDNQSDRLALHQQKAVILADSVRNMQLRIQMMKSNMNYTMRHLSSSWQYFYEGNYRDALQEVEMAIQLNPDLAIAYARRGSIYFKLGDTQRATINWNLALKLDPEYDDVRNTLRALKEGRLKTPTFTQK